MSRILNVRAALFAIAVLLFVPAGFAVDGTVLINQNTSVNGLPGCAHSGFPIQTDVSGGTSMGNNVGASGRF